MCQTATLDTLWWSLARTTIPIARDKAIRTNLFKGKQRSFFQVIIVLFFLLGFFWSNDLYCVK